MFTDDPTYGALVAYFQSGNPLYVNANSGEMDTLCITLTGYPAASLPSSATQLLALYEQMQDRLTNATTYFTEIQTWSSLLVTTDATLTVAYIEDQCMECVLPDFQPIISAWQARATANPEDPTLLSDILTFVNNQQNNLTNYGDMYTSAQQAVTAMSAFSGGSANQNALLATALKSLLSLVQTVTAEFGTIGASPGQLYQQWLASVGGNPLATGSGVNTSNTSALSSALSSSTTTSTSTNAGSGG